MAATTNTELLGMLEPFRGRSHTETSSARSGAAEAISQLGRFWDELDEWWRDQNSAEARPKRICEDLERLLVALDSLSEHTRDRLSRIIDLTKLRDQLEAAKPPYERGGRYNPLADPKANPKLFLASQAYKIFLKYSRGDVSGSQNGQFHRFAEGLYDSIAEDTGRGDYPMYPYVRTVVQEQQDLLRLSDLEAQVADLMADGRFQEAWSIEWPELHDTTVVDERGLERPSLMKKVLDSYGSRDL